MVSPFTGKYNIYNVQSRKIFSKGEGRWIFLASRKTAFQNCTQSVDAINVFERESEKKCVEKEDKSILLFTYYYITF